MTAVSVDVKSNVLSFLLLLASLTDCKWSVWSFLLSLTSLADRMTAVSMVLPLVADVSNRPYDCGLCGREVQRSFLPLVAGVSNRLYVICVVLPLVANVSSRPYDCGLCGREANVPSLLSSLTGPVYTGLQHTMPGSALLPRRTVTVWLTLFCRRTFPRCTEGPWVG